MREHELFSHVESALPTQTNDEPVPMAVFLAAEDAAPMQDGQPLTGAATVTPVTATSTASREQRRFERRVQARREDRADAATA
jgi:hypothetical protein